MRGKRQLNKRSDEKPKKRRRRLSDEIKSDSDSEIDTKPTQDYSESDSELEETAQEKRIRLAKDYLAQVEAQAAAEASDEEIDNNLVAQRLKQDALEQSGKLYTQVAHQYVAPTPEDVTLLRGHNGPVTCCAISNDGLIAFSAGKDSTLNKWCLKTDKKLKKVAGGRKGTEEQHVGHCTHIMAMALSTDNKFLATGDMNKMIYVWNPETMERLGILKGHRAGVTGLSFQRNTHTLFSGSQDKTLKVWNLDEMAFVETLFGHMDTIMCVDSLNRERAISCGARDNSVRIWKIPEESQLVYLGDGNSIDCVSLINNQHFVTGSDDNCISLWSIMKKKPIVKIPNAHPTCPDDNVCDQNNWISALACNTFTDLIASGSKDGTIRLWQCSPNFRGLELLHTISVPGFINRLQFSSDGTVLIAAVGQEHRMGRWWRIKDSKNGTAIIRLKKTEDGQTKVVNPNAKRT